MTDDREYRVLIVDDQRDVARVLRASLELLNRGYVIVDVPSAEEAMLELTGKPFDLLITDYHLPGMTGPEFIQRIRRKTPGIKAMVISGHPPAEVKHKLGDIAVEAIFEKPLDTQAFTRAVEVALHGEQEVAARPATATTTLGDIPEIEERPVFLLLGSLLADLGASGVALVNRAGTVTLKQGQIGESLRFSELAVLLAYNFTTTAEISEYLGKGPAGAVHYYNGSGYDVFALSVGIHYFLTIIFPPDNQKQMGAVLRFGRQTVEALIALLGDRAFSSDGKALEAAAVAEAPPAEAGEREAVMEPAAEVEVVEEEPALPDEDDLSMVMSLAGADESVQPLDIDFGALDAELGGSSDLDSFWSAAAAEASADEDAVSLDEAMELGLMDLDESG